MKMILAIRSNMSLCKFDGYGVRVIFYIKNILNCKKERTYIYTYKGNNNSLSIYNCQKVVVVMKANLVMSLIYDCPYSF